mmetsp:Transcript_20733/g.64059  ORF Transcript_20733/g.64059 Transcript_20733/m.64059 type:complete len:250 (-) Transcript_20733:113-862(-)
MDDFFDNDTARALRACAEKNSAAENPLSAAFAATRGAKARFTAPGVAMLRASETFGCFAKYFDAVRDPTANGWVLNVLVCAPSEEPPVGWHVDQTLRVPWDVFAGRRAALSVDVWYADVPDGLLGGELDLVQFHPPWLRRHGTKAMKRHQRRRRSEEEASTTREEEEESLRAEESRNVVNATIVAPKTNRRVTFRGDAHHRVRPFSSSSQGGGGRRVSVVLEQYRVPHSFLARFFLFFRPYLEQLRDGN